MFPTWEVSIDCYVKENNFLQHHSDPNLSICRLKEKILGTFVYFSRTQLGKEPVATMAFSRGSRYILNGNDVKSQTSPNFGKQLYVIPVTALLRIPYERCSHC